MTAPMGIIAAAGDMPLRLADLVSATGRPVFIIALKNIATADFSAYSSVTLRVGGFKAITDALSDNGCAEVMLAGKFQRPRLAEAFPDAMASKVAMKIMSKGDDAALTVIRDLFDDMGITMVDTTEFLGKTRAGSGLIAGPAADDDVMAQIAKGCAVLQSLGSHDVGQTVVIQGQRVIAVEAAEGTDMMISRCHDLVDTGLGKAVMVKLLKSDQDPSLDPPVIGSETVNRCHQVGIKVIAVQADGVIIPDLDDTIRCADQVGITLIGITP